MAMNFSCSSHQISIISRNPDPQIQFKTNPLLIWDIETYVFFSHVNNKISPDIAEITWPALIWTISRLCFGNASWCAHRWIAADLFFPYFSDEEIKSRLSLLESLPLKFISTIFRYDLCSYIPEVHKHFLQIMERIFYAKIYKNEK